MQRWLFLWKAEAFPIKKAQQEEGAINAPIIARHALTQILAWNVLMATLLKLVDQLLNANAVMKTAVSAHLNNIAPDALMECTQTKMENVRNAT